MGAAPVVLSVAGSDSGGGAGIQADVKTFMALGVHGATAVTAVTAQGPARVGAVHPLPPEIVVAQIEEVFAAMPVGAVKTGMLASGAIAAEVAAALARLGPPVLVVDPVIVASSGHALLDPAGVGVVAELLVPMADVLTPNLAEAGALLGREVVSAADMREAAVALGELGAAAVLVTGGHLAGAPVDLLWDGAAFTEIEGVRIDSPHTHGTGCTHSAALAALLARGESLQEAARAAQGFVAASIRAGRGGSVAQAPGGGQRG